MFFFDIEFTCTELKSPYLRPQLDERRPEPHVHHVHRHASSWPTQIQIDRLQVRLNAVNPFEIEKKTNLMMMNVKG